MIRALSRFASLGAMMMSSATSALRNGVDPGAAEATRAPYRAEIMAAGNSPDPYYGIKARGRRGAAARARLNAEAFALTAIGQRNAWREARRNG